MMSMMNLQMCSRGGFGQLDWRSVDSNRHNQQQPQLRELNKVPQPPTTHHLNPDNILYRSI